MPAWGSPSRAWRPASAIGTAVWQAIESGRPTASDTAATLARLTVTGSARDYRVRTMPMRDDGGTLLGSVTLLEDVTHLREIDRVKSEFIAVASHELRTPLTSALMGIQLLLEARTGDLSGRQRELLEMCREDGERLDRLMQELLDVSRLEAGRLPAVVSPVEVGEVDSQRRRYHTTAGGREGCLPRRDDRPLDTGRARRPEPNRTRAHQSPEQCHSRDRAGGHHHGPRRPCARQRGRLGSRYGPRHSSRVPAAPVREVQSRAWRFPRRRRPRALDRQAHRRVPRRPDLGRSPSRREVTEFSFTLPIAPSTSNASAGKVPS